MTGKSGPSGPFFLAFLLGVSHFFTAGASRLYTPSTRCLHGCHCGVCDINKELEMTDSQVKSAVAMPSFLARMRWAMGGVVLAVGAMAGMAAFAAHEGGHHGACAAKSAGGMLMGMPMEGRHQARWFKQLNVTDAQKTQLEALAKSQRDAMGQAREAHQALHQEMLALLKQPTLDDAAVQTLRAKVLAHHQEMLAKRWQAGVDMARLLTPEQRQKLADTMRKRMAHGHAGHERHE
jgi:periplasmic protein CpxP/Spy